MRLSLAALRFPADAPFELVPLSSEQIRERAPKVVTKPETMNYRTLLPEPGGLFDPRLFGPGTVIDAALPATDEPVKPRKTQFARIPLAEPMVHPLFLQHVRQEVGELIGKEAVDISRAAASLEAGRALVAELAGKHEGVLLRELPVLPPDLRALRRDDEDRWATTPLNVWYQRVLNRNSRLEKLKIANAPPLILDEEYTQLADAIRGLAENDESPDPVRDGAGTTMPSLRTLCGGTLELYRASKELAERGASEEPLPGRLYVARSVLFALGFDVRATA